MSVPAKPFPKTSAEVEPYVDILGMDMAIEFLLTFGGATMGMPKHPTTRSRVAALVGKEKTAERARSDHLLQRRVPLATPWLVACLHIQGWPVAGIARRLRITDMTVRRYLNRYRMRGTAP